VAQRDACKEILKKADINQKKGGPRACKASGHTKGKT